MENLSCQDILRHDGPFRQGVCQSSTVLWDCRTQPWCLWSSNQRCCRYLSQCWRFLLVSGMIYWLSSLCLSPFYPQLGQLPPLLLFLAVRSCLLPCTFLNPCGQHPGPLYLGQRAVVTPLHNVLPEVSVRTRCRLMASSKNPATFSLSSSFMKA